ncbi:hypothetical protein T440DRAFT_490332 [Plenodomus tracheiphilus IPT5]|uniref:GPI anchored protein n=1 Tax=Plenodomus tracheiphilus IPT5 TaxID=1408161 RepID=A0A6A7B4Z6_9PLEO|nr:hypothetical protein T440DRAFT_490332 [Plenodomus tracheiphilus IPT5]
MAKFFTSLLALSALAFNVAVASTAFSSDLAPAPSSSVVEPQVPIIFSTELSTTTVIAGPSSEATSTTCITVTVTTAVTSTVIDAKPSNSDEGNYTIQTQTSLPVSIPSVQPEPARCHSGVYLEMWPASGLPTSAVIIPVPANSTIVPSATALPTGHAGTNMTSGASTGGPRPTASASFPPEIINAASGVNCGYAALAVAVGAAVFGI